MISDLDVAVTDHETRLTGAEENIQGRYLCSSTIPVISNSNDECEICFNEIYVNI